MANKPLNISESAAVQMPMKTVASNNFSKQWVCLHTQRLLQG